MAAARVCSDLEMQSACSKHAAPLESRCKQVNRGSLFKQDDVWILRSVSFYCNGKWTEGLNLDPWKNDPGAPVASAIDVPTTRPSICSLSKFQGVKSLRISYVQAFVAPDRDEHLVYPFIGMECQDYLPLTPPTPPPEGGAHVFWFSW